MTWDTLWRARIDLRMHRLVQHQTHLPIHRSIFVYTSSRSVFEALHQRCDGHSGFPHAVLTSESDRHVSFLPKQLVACRENLGEIPYSILSQRNSGTVEVDVSNVKNWLVQLKTTITLMRFLKTNMLTNLLTNLMTNLMTNLLISRMRSNLSSTCMLLTSYVHSGHPSKGLMLRLLRDANASPEMIAVARVFHCSTVI